LLKLLKSVIASHSKFASVPGASAAQEHVELLQDLLQEAELQQPEAAELTTDKLHDAVETVRLFQQMSRAVFGLQPGVTAVISNGRMLVDSEPFAGKLGTLLAAYG
jgi:hypothetical protein